MKYDQGPLCYLYIPKFMEIGPLVPEKKIFKAFTINGCGSHLGQVTNIILTHFHFLVPKSLHTKFGQKRSKGFGEIIVLILICK